MESSLFQSGNFDKISTSRMSYSDKFSTLTADKKEWLKNNLPVFAQPKIDVDNGYGLLGVFVSFDIAKNSVAGTSENRVHLRIIYKVRFRILIKCQNH